ncbi:glycosyltransferase family 2 protein [candidate division NPL-UPA2 bacterium]|nr:glycosyltransferase family 2 protein [candidate division NPL-UPA2 bacterium]
MDISFVIVNWNTKELLLDCLSSIYTKVNDLEFEVFVVDNGSLDGSLEAVRANFPQVRLIENGQNFGFARAANRALRRISGRYAVLLNTDTILEKGAVEKLAVFMDKTPRAGIAAGQLLHRDGSKQNSFDNFPSLLTLTVNKALLSLLWPKRFLGKRKRYHNPIEVESVIGACMLVRKKAIEKVGELDEDYFFFFEETDWCFRMREQGWGVYHVPGARIIHLQGATANRFHSRARIEFYRSRYLFYRKHRGEPALAGIRVTVFVKLVLNFLFLALGCLMSAGTVAEWRRKLATYARLLFWHLRWCPEENGLRKIKGENLSENEALLQRTTSSKECFCKNGIIKK